MVRLESTIKRYVGNSTDAKPRPGVRAADGITPSANDIPAGSTFLECDTGRLYRWTGSDWIVPSVEDETLLVLGELLLEMRAMRTGTELVLALAHGLNCDLKTEAITKLEET